MTKLSYADKLNIPSLSIEESKTIIKDEIKNTLRMWDDPNAPINPSKQTYRLVGPAGLGKTAICKQITNELSEDLGKNFDMIKLQCPVLSRDDFLVPFPDKNEEFGMLLAKFIPKDPNSYGLLVIDELSRGDHSLQQLMWQLENENMIHDFSIPKGWFVVSLDNPDDQEYQIESLEDAAGIRRKAQIYVEFNSQDFLEYARRSNFFPSLLKYFEQNPSSAYDFEDQRQGRVYTNPASIERFSEMCWKYHMAGGVDKHEEKIRQLAESLFNRSKATPIVDFMLEREKNVNVQDIVHNYEQVKDTIEEWVQDHKHDKLGELVQGLVSYLGNTKPTLTHENEYPNLEKFLCTIPIDTAAMILTETESRFSQDSHEFKFMTIDFFITLRDSKDDEGNKLYKDFQDFFQKLDEIRKQKMNDENQEQEA